MLFQIVQIRTNATQNSPTPASSESPKTPPSEPPGRDGGEKSNTARNIFIGLLVAAASLGGVIIHYSSISFSL